MASPNSTHRRSEEWRDIPGWHGLYQASSRGRIRGIDRTIIRRDGRTIRVPQTVLKPGSLKYGHQIVGLYNSGEKKRSVAVHRLIARAFLGECPPGEEVCHIDGDPRNNSVENLRYGTRNENVKDSVRHGTHQNSRKTKCNRGHALAAPNLTAASMRKGHRSCLACARAHSRVYQKPALRTHFQDIADTYYYDIMNG